MMKAIPCAILAVVMLACGQQPKTDEASFKRTKSLALFERNKEVLQIGLEAFQREQMEVWADGVSDTVVWNSSAYGSRPGSKEDWRKVLDVYITNWDSIRLNNAVFLPGLDTGNYEPDGSVRYYGQWDGVHISGIRTSINFYGTYEFNSVNKIVNAQDFFDVSGLMIAVSPKGK